ELRTAAATSSTTQLHAFLVRSVHLGWLTGVRFSLETEQGEPEVTAAAANRVASAATGSISGGNSEADDEEWQFEEVLVRPGLFNLAELSFVSGDADCRLSATQPDILAATGWLSGSATQPRPHRQRRCPGRLRRLRLRHRRLENLATKATQTIWVAAACPLTLHGSLGTSGPHRLHEPGRLPAAGEQLQLASVGSGGFGDLGKISLQLDSHRPEDQVHLASLRLSDLEQPLDFFFPLDCSLEAGQQAEFNASRPGVPQAVSLDYRVSLRLGSARNCGSSAVTSMRIVLHGDLGSSAPGRLLNLRLLPGQTVSRNVRCLSVGHLHSVTIGHEQRAAARASIWTPSAWRDRAPESRRFRCQRWLDSAWGDGQTQATLTDSAEESSDGEKKQPGDLLYELEVHAEPLQRLAGLRVRLHPNAKDDAATAATADSLPAAPLKRHQLQVDDVNDSQRQRCLYTFRYPQLPRVAALSLWEDSEDFEDEDKGGEVTDIDGVEEAAAAAAVTSTPLAVTRLRLLQDHRDRFAFVCSRPAQLRVGGGPPTRFALLA
uniref:PLAT domain-containing protein n=1 Tax=Macrostomum lignano TaxID=282301 RepID=A0A1I8F3W7_9PLAT